MSSDSLRVIGRTGDADLDASREAFAVLDLVVSARVRRGLTTVIDTLGLDADRRRSYLDAAPRRQECRRSRALRHRRLRCARERNSARDRPVPADIACVRSCVGSRRRAWPNSTPRVGTRWLVVSASSPSEPAAPLAARTRAAQSSGRRVHVADLALPVGRQHRRGWLGTSGMAQAAADAGFAGIALMDHLIQIPQVDRSWEPIPEPWVTLGLVAGLDTGLQLGTSVSPMSMHSPGIARQKRRRRSTC